mmetsp:Transcript_57668/g.103048  ORF Transcript_57668/g.103048 Transcript_57668/m.103048 type:complete len:410 (-) Transcript_57668:434-1663(-)
MGAGSSAAAATIVPGGGSLPCVLWDEADEGGQLRGLLGACAVVDHLSLHGPLGGLCNLDLHIHTDLRLVRWDQDLCVALRVSHQVVPVVGHLRDVHALCGPDEALMLCGARRLGLKYLSDLPTSGLDDLGVQRLHGRSRGALAGVELGDVQEWELHFLAQLGRLLEILLRFSWETADDVRRNVDPWDPFAQLLHNILELLHRVLSLHDAQHSVGASLHRDVQVGVHIGMIQGVTDHIQVLQHIWGVGHPQTQHDSVRDVGDHRLQQLADVRPDVSPVGPSVLRGETDFLDPFGHHLLHPGADLINGPAAQVTTGMFGLAICALIQAPNVDWNNLDPAVSPHLWKVQTRAILLSALEEVHLVPPEGFLNHFHNAVDLLHANDAQIIPSTVFLVSLGDTACNDDRLASLLC